MKMKKIPKKPAKSQFLLVGELRNPSSYFFNGKELPNVFRVLGSERHGYVYQFVSADGKRKATVNPMWDDLHKVPEKKRKYAQVNDIVYVFKTMQKALVHKYLGFGFYLVEFADGTLMNCSVESFFKRNSRENI